MGENLKNVRIKKVAIELDKVRHLQFDLNAFAEMEEKFGSIEEALNILQKGKLKALRTILWAGLVHEDENLTEAQVGSFIDLTNIQQVAEKLNDAIMSALPNDTEEESDPNLQKK